MAIGLVSVACARVDAPPAGSTSPPAPSASARQPRAPRAGADAPAARDGSTSRPVDRLEDVATSADTYDTLRVRYGDAALARETFHGAEGAEAPGWVLFPDEPARRIEVWLNDAGDHPSALAIRGASTWQRADGVRIGLTTLQLEKLNRRAFEFAGFGWDYGGVVTDWKGGTLAHDGRFAGPVTLCEPANPPEGYPTGDGAFMSDSAVVRKQPPTVCEFGVDLSDASSASR